MDSQTASSTTKDAVAYTVSITQDLNSARKEQAFCDATLVVGDKEYPAHKIVLSVFSPVFKRMFSGNFSEAETSSATLKNVEPDVMDDILEFAYTGTFKCIWETAVKMLQAAHFLQAESLLAKCSQFLGDNANLENCFYLCELSELYSCPSLGTKASTYMARNFPFVCKKEAFLELKLDFLSDIIQNNNLNAPKEEQVFEAVLQWVKFKEDDRKSYLPRLLRLIRLGLLERQYLLNCTKTEEALWLSMECMQVLFEVQCDLQSQRTFYAKPRASTEIAICVKTHDNRTFDLKGKYSDSIENIMDKVELQTNIPVAEQRLTVAGLVMDRNRHLFDYVSKLLKCTIYVDQRIPIIVVYCPGYRNEEHGTVSPSDSIETLRDEFKVSPDVKLYFSGTILRNSRTVSSYNIRSGSILICCRY